MSSEDATFDPETFGGRVRLFPLPNVVLLPHVVQPLHIFEPRYRELMEDALADDRLIAMAVLEAGWEADYDGRPPIAPMACLGKIVTHQRLEDGKFNLLLAGVARVAIVRELPPERLFRQAEARLVADSYAKAHAQERGRLHKRLLAALEKHLEDKPQMREALRTLLVETIPLGTLVDLLGYALDLPHELKRMLLCEASVELRLQMVHLWLELESQGETAPAEWENLLRKFPPEFSDN